ncbi:MAG: hypothetical protein P4L33_17890 [Capsulimonadaceae bacterium]|nr:hypothetical protein [Capsulimonadaceae bacterium]
MSFKIVASVLALVASMTFSWAQNGGHIGYVYPAGGQQGTSVTVKVGGQALKGVFGVYMSGDGVVGTVSDYFRPLNNTQALILTDKLKAAAQKLQTTDPKVNLPNLDDPSKAALIYRIAQEAGLTDKDLMALAEYRNSRRDPKKQQNQQIEEIATVVVNIGPDAQPGFRELRLLTPTGVTNAIHFVVSQATEQTEVKPNDKLPNDLGDKLPAVANGQILPGEVAKWTFAAHKGQHLIIDCCARELVPYLADAVPGWFQAAIELYDSKGNQIDYADHYLFHPDPLIHFDVPADDKYLVVVHDALYRGREDFVYRLTVGEMPLVSSIFPLGGSPSAHATVKAVGWNLASDKISVDTSSRPNGVYPIVATSGKIESNPVPFAVDGLPEIVAKEAGEDGTAVERVTLPVIVNGRISQPREVHTFRFLGKAGQKIVAEVYARRLNSPMDSALQLTDSHGKVIAFNDDAVDLGAGLVTHQADSYLTATLPAAGSYDLSIWDTQSKGGVDFVYRLRISPPRPDFDLRILPSALNIRRGPNASGTFTVQAIRRDGYSGPIEVRLKDAPAGFVVSGAPIPALPDKPAADAASAAKAAAGDKATFKLTVPKMQPGQPVTLVLQGKAMIGGVPVIHDAVPADDQMQAFAYHHLVPTSAWLIDVMGSPVAK